ncbi:hypothetical protein AA637_07600 [Cyanobacterium sp. HL-69]|nr:hypothetical protein AA637_07600 [Cyanobacterium sp. HL-69]
MSIGAIVEISYYIGLTIILVNFVKAIALSHQQKELLSRYYA